MKVFFKYIFFVLCSVTLLMSCKKDYYQDGGVHNPNYDGSIMDFLDSRKDLFDTLAQIIRIADYDKVLNGDDISFFAAPDPTISKSLRNLNRYLYINGQDTVEKLDQIDPDIWRFFLARYTLKEKMVLKDFPQLDTTNMGAYPGQGYLTHDDEPMHLGVIYNDVVTKNSDGVSQTVKYAGYRQLHISAYGGFTISGLTVAPVATSDIQPKNGVVHVLQFSKHSFGFDSDDFIQKVYARGIRPLTN